MISELGRELYDRLRSMAEHFVRLGAQLDRAVAAYNEAAGSIERRVLVTARRLRDQGAGSAEEIPVLDTIDGSARVLQPALPEAESEES